MGYNILFICFVASDHMVACVELVVEVCIGKK